MRSKVNKVLKIILPLLFWLTIWEAGSKIFQLKYGDPKYKFFLPSVFDTFRALLNLLSDSAFYESVLFTLLRVVVALIVGIIVGVILAYASYKFDTVKMIITPFFSVMRSTPIASIIIILYVIIHNANVLTVCIAVLMIAPIIWQNVLDSFDSVPNDLREVCEAFEIKRLARFKILIFPTVLRFLIPAIITSSSLCWKATVSAEIIVLAEKSIGDIITEAKSWSQTAVVFACTIVVITLSIIFEKLSKYLLRRCEQWL